VLHVKACTDYFNLSVFQKGLLSRAYGDPYAGTRNYVILLRVHPRRDSAHGRVKGIKDYNTIYFIFPGEARRKSLNIAQMASHEGLLRYPRGKHTFEVIKAGLRKSLLFMLIILIESNNQKNKY